MRRSGWAVMVALLMAAGPETTLRQADATGVLGRSVSDSDGRDVGRIVDVVVSPTGSPVAVVIDTGGFMGVGARRVAVEWAAVHVPAPGSADAPVTIAMTDEQVRTAPEYTDRTKPAVIVGPPAAGEPAVPDAAAPAAVIPDVVAPAATQPAR